MGQGQGQGGAMGSAAIQAAIKAGNVNIAEAGRTEVREGASPVGRTVGRSVSSWTHPCMNQSMGLA